MAGQPSPALASFERMLAAGRDGALLRFSLGNEYLKAGEAGAQRKGDKQAGKEMDVFARRIEKALAADGPR